MRIFLVDDEIVALSSVKRLLNRRGFSDVEICDSGLNAIEKILHKEYDVVLLDLLMPEVDGLEILQSTKAHMPRTEFIMLTAVDDVATAVKAIHLGAYDYLVKPVENEKLILAIERAFERKGLMAGLAGGSAGRERGVPPMFADITTRCPRMLDLLYYAEIMARSDVPVLMTGETGTGKELIARDIHRGWQTAAGPFVGVNVSAIQPSLFESQFFGYIKGAFTGADSDTVGFFEQANGGTLFLDEIGELPLNLQVKFLRVVEEKMVIRVGDTRPIFINPRIVSATNQNLEAACRDGRFRLDLFYRLKAAHIHLPPLREREGDIPLLATAFLEKANQRYQKNIERFSPAAMACLMKKQYPGNIISGSFAR
jgi:DNA-binding NtrC family response regulator